MTRTSVHFRVSLVPMEEKAKIPELCTQLLTSCHVLNGWLVGWLVGCNNKSAFCWNGFSVCVCVYVCVFSTAGTFFIRIVLFVFINVWKKRTNTHTRDQSSFQKKHKQNQQRPSFFSCCFETNRSQSSNQHTQVLTTDALTVFSLFFVCFCFSFDLLDLGEKRAVCYQNGGLPVRLAQKKKKSTLSQSARRNIVMSSSIICRGII